MLETLEFKLYRACWFKRMFFWVRRLECKWIYVYMAHFKHHTKLCLWLSK